MSETVTLTESEVRKNIAVLLRGMIVNTAEKQQLLKKEAAPLYRSESESERALAHDKYLRRMDNRKSLRAMNLAYAFVRGVPLEKVEARSHEERPLSNAMLRVFAHKFPGFNSDHRSVLSAEFKRWAAGQKQEFFAAREAARAEAVRAVAE